MRPMQVCMYTTQWLSVFLIMCRVSVTSLQSTPGGILKAMFARFPLGHISKYIDRATNKPEPDNRQVPGIGGRNCRYRETQRRERVSISDAMTSRRRHGDRRKRPGSRCHRGRISERGSFCQLRSCRTKRLDIVMVRDEPSMQEPVDTRFVGGPSWQMLQQCNIIHGWCYLQVYRKLQDFRFP